MSDTVTTDLKAADVAKTFGCTKRKVTDLATKLRIGYNLGGSAGFRFTPADVIALREAMKPAPTPARRRRRRT